MIEFNLLRDAGGLYRLNAKTAVLGFLKSQVPKTLTPSCPMSRSIDIEIGDESHSVYHYASGMQSSDMRRIHDDFGLGEYYLEVDNNDGPGFLAVRREDFIQGMDVAGDLLILDRSELSSLKEQLEKLKQNIRDEDDEWFCQTAEAIYKAGLKYADVDRLRFSGEY